MSLAEAKQELGVKSQAVVKHWVELGWLQGPEGQGGKLEVLRADVVREKTIREGLSAIGGREMTPEELDELVAGGPGTLPWERAGDEASR